MFISVDPHRMPKVLALYLKITQYPILARRIRERMRQEIFSRGIISPRVFEEEVREMAILSQKREGLFDSAQESPEIWEERIRQIREHLTDFYFAHNLPHELFEDIVQELMAERVLQPEDLIMPFNPALAPTDLIFAQGEEFESYPPEKRAKVQHHLQEIIVVLIKSMISDQLSFVGIAKEWFTIADLKEIRRRRIGRGKIGGKAGGLLLAWKILQEEDEDDEIDIKSHLAIPESYFIGADVFYDFLSLNRLHDTLNQKYKTRETMEADYPAIREAYIGGRFPDEIVYGLRELLEEVGNAPLIVRSSSLLEDNFGTSFAGKFHSFFCPNQGTLEENLEALTLAISKVYASVPSPVPILYRQRMGLVDYDERMAVLIQKVQGTRYGHFFFPALAGVGFSLNPFRWNPRIRQEDGFLRVVWGLSTRAVERVASDYPRMVALSHPQLRPEAGADEIKRYSQHFIDLIDLADNQLKTLPISEVLSGDYPSVRFLASVDKGDYLQPMFSQSRDMDPQELVLTFETLLKDTTLVPLMKAILKKLERGYGWPVDIEFTANIMPRYPDPQVTIHLVQCRPQILGMKPPRIYHNLPQPDYGTFIGREKELAQMHRILRPYPHSQYPLVTIDGIGGIGKSTLALEVAHRYLREYDTLSEEERFEAIIWTSAKSYVLTADGIATRQQVVRTLDDIYATIAVTLEREDIIDAPFEEQSKLVRYALISQPTLLIVDSLEMVDDERVNAFLRELPPPTKAIITTRHRIDIAYPVRLTGMPKEDGLVLIAQECAKKGVTLTEAEAEKLYDRTGGVPLAIVWSVSRMGYGYDVEAVLHSLSQPSEDLVRYVFEAAMQRIRGTDAHRLLMALSLFAADASRDALGYMAGLRDDILSRDEGLVILERLSLVNREGSRFSILPLTRVFVREEALNDPHFRQLAESEWSSERIESQLKQFEAVWSQVSEKPSEPWTELQRARFQPFASWFQESISLGRSTPNTELVPVSFGEFVVCGIDVTYAFRDTTLPSPLPLVFFVGKKLTDKNVQGLLHLLRRDLDPRAQLALLVAPDPDSLQDIRSFCRGKVRAAFAFDIVVAGRTQLQQVLVNAEADRALRRLMLSDASLLSFSPFVIIGPTPDNMFFGRESELRRVVERCDSISYAVIGGRRVGKSSLLARLHRVRLPAVGFRTIYHDCSSTSSHAALLATVIRDWRPEPPADVPSTFGDLLEPPPSDKPFVLLLDEADKLVPADRAAGWQLFNTLRALANSGRAQVVLSGERTLSDALRDPKSPLFNFANEIFLGPLDYPAVEELVTRPMKQLEIELIDEKAIVDLIWAFTSGHPNVVQRLCRRLIERLNEQDTRRITADDVSGVIEDPGFQRDDFLSTYWEAATSLEKIISLLMADDEGVRTLRAVRQALAERCNLRPKAREVDDALQRLVDLRSILKRTPTGYKFAVEAFPRVVAETMTLDDMLEILTEEYQEQGE
jgi:AAA+ ATPase superfamily predicted ATPase